MSHNKSKSKIFCTWYLTRTSALEKIENNEELDVFDTIRAQFNGHHPYPRLPKKLREKVYELNKDMTLLSEVPYTEKKKRIKPLVIEIFDWYHTTDKGRILKKMEQAANLYNESVPNHPIEFKPEDYVGDTIEVMEYAFLNLAMALLHKEPLPIEHIKEPFYIDKVKWPDFEDK